MSDTALLVLILADGRSMGFLELKQCLFKGVCFECGGGFVSEHDRRYVSLYFNPPSVRVACNFFMKV